MPDGLRRAQSLCASGLILIVILILISWWRTDYDYDYDYDYESTTPSELPCAHQEVLETKGRMDGSPRHSPFPLSFFPVFRAGFYLRTSEH